MLFFTFALFLGALAAPHEVISPDDPPAGLTCYAGTQKNQVPPSTGAVACTAGISNCYKIVYSPTVIDYGCDTNNYCATVPANTCQDNAGVGTNCCCNESLCNGIPAEGHTMPAWPEEQPADDTTTPLPTTAPVQTTQAPQTTSLGPATTQAAVKPAQTTVANVGPPSGFACFDGVQASPDDAASTKIKTCVNANMCLKLTPTNSATTIYKCDENSVFCNGVPNDFCVQQSVGTVCCCNEDVCNGDIVGRTAVNWQTEGPSSTTPSPSPSTSMASSTSSTTTASTSSTTTAAQPVIVNGDSSTTPGATDKPPAVKTTTVGSPTDPTTHTTTTTHSGATELTLLSSVALILVHNVL